VRRPRALLIPVALAAAAALAVPAPAVPTAAEAAIAPDLCPAGSVATPGLGLDGGIGCESLVEVEDPTVAGFAARTTAADAVRAAGSGADGLRAWQQAQALRQSAEARRASAGTRDFVARGAVVKDSGARWTEVGPRPLNNDDPAYPGGRSGTGTVSGRVAALHIDRSDPTGKTVLLGAAGGGVWRSTNAGDTWTDLSAKLPTLAIGAIGMVGKRIVVGTGEPNTGTDNYAGFGVFYSDDTGRTWKRSAGAPADSVISRVEVTGQRVFVATSLGLYRSTDGAVSFKRVVLPTAGPGKEGTLAYQNWVSDVRVRPRVPNEVTAAVGWRSGGVPGKGLYRSTDGGVTFTALSGVAFGQVSESADKIGRTTITYQYGPEQSNSVIWAVIEEPGKVNDENNPLAFDLTGQPVAKVPFTTLNGIYRSGDDGATWELKGNYETLVVAPGSSYTPTFTPSQTGPGAQSWYNQWIAVDPRDENRVLVGLEEIFETASPASAPGPASWKVVGRYGNSCAALVAVPDCPTYTGKTTHPDQHAVDMVVLPGGITRAYVGNDGGPYRQDVSGSGDYTSNGWQSLSDPTLSTMQPHEAVMSGDGTIYTGMQDNGTAKITSKGYAASFLGGDGFHVAVDPENSDIVYAEVQNGSIRRSTNGGKTAPTSITPSGSTRPQFNTPFEMDPTNPDHLVFATGQIWGTTKAPTVSTSGWTNMFDLGGSNSANALDVQGAAVYAAFCSECNALPNLGEGGTIDPKIFSGGIATNIKAGCDPAPAKAACWHVATAKGLPKRFVGGLSISPKDPRTVYVAVSSYRRRFAYQPGQRGQGLVFVSKDGAESFTDITGNLPDTFGADVILAGDRLVAATDHGVFVTPASAPGDWVPMGTGLPAVPAYKLQLNPQGTKLVLATHGRGVWTLPLSAAAPPSGGGGTVGRPRVPGGQLPSTGLPAWVLVAPVLLAAGFVLRRRRPSRS
jgi:hypothetical protein